LAELKAAESNNIRFQSFALILATRSELTQTVAVNILDLLGFSFNRFWGVLTQLNAPSYQQDEIRA